MSALGDYLEKRRLEMGISRRKLAELSDMSHSIINDIINDKVDVRRLKVETLEKLSRGAGVRYETLATLCVPGRKNEPSVQRIKITEEINSLPEEHLGLVETLLAGLRLEQRNRLKKNGNGDHTKSG